MDLGQLIKKRTRNYKEKSVNDEYFFLDIERDILSEVNPEQAFKLIDEMVEIVLNEKDSFLRGKLFHILCRLVRRSDTTQMPTLLSTKLEELEHQVTSIDAFYNREYRRFFKRWYRIKDK